ncbi:MAG: 5-formyltetrahydrofolate cyclo-ligase [Bradymonadaceae bacterium]
MADGASDISKDELRSEFRSRRRALDAEARAEASGAICRRLATIEELDARSPVAGYVADDGELRLHAFLEERLSAGDRVVLPRVEGDRLVFAPVTDFDALEPGSYGIPEPSTPAVSIEAVAAILVPGVAFDRGGRRIGRGAGYYDRVLARRRSVGSPALTVGICHHCQLADPPLPQDKHDVRVDLVVTDREVVATSDRFDFH